MKFNMNNEYNMIMNKNLVRLTRKVIRSYTRGLLLIRGVYCMRGFTALMPCIALTKSSFHFLLRITRAF